MKVTEKILIALVLIALILKFNLIPGSSVLFLFASLTLSMLYFGFSFLLSNGIRLRNTFKKEAYVGISGLRMTYTILAGFSMSVMLIGIIFKLMYWPGAGVNLLLGTFTALIGLVVAIIKYIGKNEVVYRNMLFRLMAYLFVANFLYFLNKETLVRFQYRSYPKYAEAFLERETDLKNEVKALKVEIERDRMYMSPEEFKQYHPEEK